MTHVARVAPIQIVNEGMLEDVNNILNSGDVPNLYGPEEMDRIMTACRPICAKKRIPATKLNVFAQVRRVQEAHHCSGPISEKTSNLVGSKQFCADWHGFRELFCD